MQQKNIIIALLVLVVVGLVGWSMITPKDTGSPQNTSDKLSVVTTLFPLYDFAKAIGGEYVDATLLLPPGVEAHAFEPKPSDMVRIDQSDIFVYTGNAMEPWAKDVRQGIAKTVTVVDMSQGIAFLKEPEGAEHGHEDEHESEHDDHGGMDPHFWLDFDNAMLMVSSLEKAFITKDPAHAESYRNNATLYRERLADLDQAYRAGLASCDTKEIVYGGHYAFGYLAHRYGLTYVSAQGLAPDAEPSAQDIALLVNQIRNNNIRFVFHEELTSPKIAETLARETKTEMLLLNAAHNISKDDYTQETTFLGIMNENLVNLRKGLNCK